MNANLIIRRWEYIMKKGFVRKKVGAEMLTWRVDHPVNFHLPYNVRVLC
jgi:hypothetical protein